MFTSQATQGYSEGLADNELESEVSSVFGLDPSIPDLPRNHDPHMSPLEYSAMLKLYRSAAIDSRGGHPSAGGNVPPGGGPSSQKGHNLKDTTPDSGVVADNNNSNSNSNQSTTSSNQKQAKHDSSQNSLLSR